MLSLLGTLAKFAVIIVKNVRRNLLRTTFTSLGTMTLVLVVTLVWSVLSFIDDQTSEKANDLKVLITEKNKSPSRLPYAYVSSLKEGAARAPDDVRPVDYMTWVFYGGMLDPTKPSRENFIFLIGGEPEKIPTMMEELDQLGPADRARLDRAVQRMKEQRNACVIGPEQLKTMNKKVGERIKVSGLIFKGIDLEFEIIDTFPDAAKRYAQTSVMNIEYLLAALEEYKVTNKKPHPEGDAPVAFVVLRVKNRAELERLTAQIGDSPLYTAPAVRCESQGSAISSFLEAYKDIFWGMRWLLGPAVLFTLSLVIANAISISVRERRMEIALLKVLGFRPGHVMGLVLGEALLIGTLSGVFSAGGAYLLINKLAGGIPFPIAWFQRFFIPDQALWWGLAVGAGTAFVGCIFPALSARSVRVADVFSKIA
ncbi:MAG: ABC transporter permease [Planctomycetaceae bacterium]|nr:ABC transporter permease [Planctomycetaceae bacterium]